MFHCCQLGKNLYQDRHDTGDVTIVVESTPIRAHRNVLATFSPWFKAKFYHSKRHKSEYILKDITVAAFEEYLQLFYFDKVQLTIQNIGIVLAMVKRSQAKDFVKKCLNFLVQRATIDKLCTVYRLAIFYDIQMLKELCERNIVNSTVALFGTDDFVHCGHKTLMLILKLNEFSCTEAKVFDACISWAQAACKAANIDETKTENLRAKLGDAITQIRFSSLPLGEFVVRHNTLKGFFTPDESNEIIYMIGKLDGFVSQKFNQTPRGLCENPVDIDVVGEFDSAFFST